MYLRFKEGKPAVFSKDAFISDKPLDFTCFILAKEVKSMEVATNLKTIDYWKPRMRQDLRHYNTRTTLIHNPTDQEMRAILALQVIDMK